MRIQKWVSLLLVSIMLFFSTSFSAKANEMDMDVWLNEAMNPTVVKVVRDFNETAQVNWYVNLSTYLSEDDKKAAVKGLKLLREDISNMREEVKAIKSPESADKKERKQIKVIKKSLLKALDRTSKSSRKLLKRFDKDKKVTTISARKYENKRISKADEAYTTLNKENDVDVAALEIIDFVKINKDEAEKIIQKHDNELTKLAKKEEQKKKEDEAKDAKAKVKKAEADAKKIKTLQFNIDELIAMSDGFITDINPFIENGWDVMNVFVDNSWHLQTDEQKKYAAETMGPVVESFVVGSGLSDHSVINFIDQNGNSVATQKMLGGYKIKK